MSSNPGRTPKPAIVHLPNCLSSPCQRTRSEAHTKRHRTCPALPFLSAGSPSASLQPNSTAISPLQHPRSAPFLTFRASRAEGSVVLFDLRLRHRGRANSATTDRPLLYLSYAPTHDFTLARLTPHHPVASFLSCSCRLIGQVCGRLLRRRAQLPRPADSQLGCAQHDTHAQADAAARQPTVLSLTLHLLPSYST